MSTLKAKSIRLLILDVDGVLTSGVVYYVNATTEIKGFHVHDGLGIKLLQACGIAVAIISARTSEALVRRAAELKIQHVYLGHENKLPAYIELQSTLKLNDEQIAYMGDDLPDLPLLQRAGFAMTVPEAPLIIQQAADYITKKSAGQGAVREAAEFIMEAQGLYQSVVESYLLKCR